MRCDAKQRHADDAAAEMKMMRRDSAERRAAALIRCRRLMLIRRARKDVADASAF